jgi:osmoprotectant transport system permease protein
VSSRRRINLELVALAAAAFAWLVSAQGFWESLLRAIFPAQPMVLMPRDTLAAFVAQHLALVGVSSAVTIVIGIPLGIFVTRRRGAEFRSLVIAATDLGQTFPPIAVLALAMPVLGFGFWPTVMALSIYGLFPVVGSAIAGIEAVPRAVLDAAEGMGMSPSQRLLRVELPLAARVIVSGVRTSVAINIGTATVGAAIGTGGLGVPIIGGLAVQNMAYVLEGAIPAAMLAVLADAVLGQIEAAVTVADSAATT